MIADAAAQSATRVVMNCIFFKTRVSLQLIVQEGDEGQNIYRALEESRYDGENSVLVNVWSTSCGVGDHCLYLETSAKSHMQIDVRTR